MQMYLITIIIIMKYNDNNNVHFFTRTLQSCDVPYGNTTPLVIDKGKGSYSLVIVNNNSERNLSCDLCEYQV